jgi:hypothetical protein
MPSAVCLAAEGVTQQEERLAQEFRRLVVPAVEKALSQPPPEQGGEIAWGESYLLSSLVEMVSATSDNTYAGLAVKLSDWISKSRDDRHNRTDEIRGKVMPAWSSTNYSGGKRFAWAVHTGMIVAPIAKFGAVVRKNPYLESRWGDDAARLLKIAREAAAAHDDEYRDGPGPDEGYIWCPYLKKHLPLNMQNALARAWLAIDDATGVPKYRERTARLARFLKNRMRKAEDGAYVWAYWPPLEGTTDKFEDISHASINVDFMVLCREHGLVFDRSDLDRVQKTLLGRVVAGSDRISNTVGGGAPYDRYSSAVFHWARLGRHAPEVRARLTEMILAPSFEPRDNSLVLGIAYLSLPPYPGE